MNWKVPNGLWQDRTVWILGGGPSLTRQFNVPQELISKIEKGQAPVSAISPYLEPIHNEIVIGVNMAFRIGNWIDMVFWGDPSFYRKPRVAEHLKKFPGLKIACHQRFNDKKMEDEDIYAIRRDKKKKGISEDPETICWNGNSGAAAISIAANAGAKKIILLGFDMCIVETHSHWHNEYGHPKKPPFKTHMQGFKTIYEDARKRGIEIINASPDSAISFFPKVSVSDILQGKFVKQIVMDTNYERSIGTLHKYNTLRTIHQYIKPDVYLEIGIGRGNSLKTSLANKNIAIDPRPRLKQKFENTKIYTQNSDEFFKQHKLDTKIDFAFIDGQHLIECVLNDFINCERNSKKDSVIVLDDVAPAHEIQAQRIKQSIKWAGDVWKIVPILKQYRPDLELKLLDVAPTGMLLVSNLDPQNKILSQNYQKIINEWQSKEMPKEIMLREGVYSNLAFLNNETKSHIKIGVVTPTASIDRKPFLDFLEKRMKKQTRKPDIWLKVDFPNNGKIDVAKRYKQGISQLFKEGCDLILFMEDDDYYPLDYIEVMEQKWIAAGRPKLFGVKGTYYYYLKEDKCKYFANNDHCSAFCTAVSKGINYQDCSDYIRSFDLWLWKNNDGLKIPIDNMPIGIKHGIGMIGRNYHALRNSNSNKKLENLVDKEAFEFYENLKKEL